MGYRTKVTRLPASRMAKLVPCNKHKDVSARLRERGSKKVEMHGRPAASQTASTRAADPHIPGAFLALHRLLGGQSAMNYSCCK